MSKVREATVLVSNGVEKLDRSVNGWGWESGGEAAPGRGAMVCQETPW